MEENFTKKYIDLHAHLDGSITVDIAKKLAELQNISLPSKNDNELLNLLSVPESCENLNDFLKCFDLPLTLLQTKEGLTEAVYLVLENMKSDGVVYAEIRFAPQLHTKKGLSQEEAVLAAVEGLKKSSIPTNLILCCMRGEGNEKENDITIELAKKYLVKDGGVVAVDLAGAEALFPNGKYTELFKKANEYKIPITIHAGEALGEESVISAIQMGAVRIGHGVRSGEKALKAILEKGIFLEMCPTSNRQTKAVENMDSYPLLKFLDLGVKATVNTDDMAIEGTTLSKEFKYLEEKFGLTPKQEKILLSNAVDAAFTNDEEKEKLRKTLGL